MNTKDQVSSPPLRIRRVGEMIETIVGCKWSFTIMDVIHRGTTRPGAIERSIEGLSAKVLGDCLKRLLDYGLLSRRSYAEIPPRVEYSFTALGARFFTALEDLSALESQAREGASATRTREQG